MEKIENPKKIITQEHTILLQPKDLTSNLKNNILDKLKKLEGKCNATGYINKIEEIVEISEGQILAENLNASCNFKIKFNSEVYKPLDNTILIAKVRSFNNEFITTTVSDDNKDIIVIINPKDKILNENWNINEYTHLKTKKQIEIGDSVKILINSTRINLNATKIICIGSLLDFYETK